MTNTTVRNQKLREKLKHQGLGSMFQMYVQEYPEIQPLLGSVPRYRKCNVKHGYTAAPFCTFGILEH